MESMEAYGGLSTYRIYIGAVLCSRKFNQFRLDVTAFIQIPNLNRISLSRLPMITKLTLVITHCKVKFILKSLPDKRNKNPASYKFNWAD